jgi:hypothetical protein
MPIPSLKTYQVKAGRMNDLCGVSGSINRYREIIGRFGFDTGYIQDSAAGADLLHIESSRPGPGRG